MLDRPASPAKGKGKGSRTVLVGFHRREDPVVSGPAEIEIMELWPLISLKYLKLLLQGSHSELRTLSCNQGLMSFVYIL